MSWTEELYNVYENNFNLDYAGESAVLLPISHLTAEAQIEITLKDDGTFVCANLVDKNDATTIIPVTEDSGSRGNGINPMPFADKLKYIAGDYNVYVKKADNTNYYEQYMKSLENWAKSVDSHLAVKAVYSYLKKSSLISDLIKVGVLLIDDSNKLDEKVKIGNNNQEDFFVRFIVNYSNDFEHENRTWLDKSLHDNFINYYKSLLSVKQLCYATGTEQFVTYKHPAKIRNTADKAKLISANDDKGFTYKGRFNSKEQALSIGYEYSQKIHNALRWLISRQGMLIDTMNIIVWASAMQDISKDILTLKKSNYDSFFSDFFDNEDEFPDTEPKHKEMLEKMIFGLKQSYSPNSKIMLMGVDAATTGRLSISVYSEFECSQFYENIKNWHLQTSWSRYNHRYEKYLINSFSLFEIIECAFGNEQDDNIVCKKEILRDNILRLIPCVTEGQKLPKDIVFSLVRKASNPLSYKNRYNHYTVCETACGMIRKYNFIQGGITEMSYNPNEKNRSYLYGCLLAIADKAESSTYRKEERDSRQTNARRYWNMFSSRPYTTWEKIRTNLNPYLNKMEYSKRKFFEYKLDEVMDKFELKEFTDNSQLEPSYLLGYHHFVNFMKYKSEKENEN